VVLSDEEEAGLTGPRAAPLEHPLARWREAPATPPLPRGTAGCPRRRGTVRQQAAERSDHETPHPDREERHRDPRDASGVAASSPTLRSSSRRPKVTRRSEREESQHEAGHRRLGAVPGLMPTGDEMGDRQQETERREEDRPGNPETPTRLERGQPTSAAIDHDGPRMETAARCQASSTRSGPPPRDPSLHASRRVGFRAEPSSSVRVPRAVLERPRGRACRILP
jgi:hypothetical protein